MSLRSGCPRALAFLLISLMCPAASAQAGTNMEPKLPAPHLASDAIPAERMREYADLAMKWEQEYLQLDTTNPPGNEARAAGFFKEIFDAEGIENQVFEVAPGRANIWACLPSGGRPTCERSPDQQTTPSYHAAIILLNHEDVVTSVPSRWKAPPFSASIINGSIYARGAQDMKSEGLAQLMVLVILKRERVPLKREIIFLATADEEVNGIGTDWMIANHPEKISDAEYLLTEGGKNLNENGKARYIGVDVAEKSPFWLVLTASGKPGHGSLPIPDSAPNHLVRALARVTAYRTPFKVLPVADEFFKAMSVYEAPERARQFRNLRQAINEPQFREFLESDSSLNYMLRNTISLTQLEGSHQTNVIPSQASAHLDVRLLPGEDPDSFLREMRAAVNDPQVKIEAESSEFRIANASQISTDLFAAIKQVASRYFPGTPVMPRLDSGYTENQRYRRLGITCYGFTPYTATEEEGATEHGDNERIRVDEVKRGFRVLYDVVGAVAADK